MSGIHNGACRSCGSVASLCADDWCFPCHGIHGWTACEKDRKSRQRELRQKVRQGKVRQRTRRRNAKLKERATDFQALGAEAGRMGSVITRGTYPAPSTAEETKKKNAKPGVEDLSGLRIGSLTVVRYYGPGGCSPWWLLRCSACGHEQTRRGNRVREARKNPQKAMACESCHSKKGGGA